MATQASCPSCGTFLSITHDSTVSMVCRRCHAVLEFRSGSLRQVGNAAVVVPTRASVQVGEEGAYSGTNFQVTGHVQLSNEDGATWDEYYLGFSDGQCGWLAQAQGRLILSFRAPLPEGISIPDFEELKLNSKLELMPGLPGVSVVEKGEARVEAANGQMPYLLRPGETYPYADFAAMNAGFASLDYSTDPPDLFVGREVSFDQLRMEPRRSEPTSERGGQGMVCTECGAQLEVRSGRSERVTCVKCRALFDVSSGRPNHVGSQEEVPVRPVVPTGSKVHFGSQEYTLTGFIQKTTSDELGTAYFWQEYLLADDQGGYRWLVQDNEGHWSLFEPITGGSEIQPVISYGGTNYKFFQHGEARVTYLEGEFYWNAAVGQTSYTADFVAPPSMLSAEFSTQDSTKGETSWTHGIYIPIRDVRQALGTSDIRKPRGVAPNQPFAHSKILPIWLLAMVATICVGIVMGNMVQAEPVNEVIYRITEPSLASLKAEGVPEPVIDKLRPMRDTEFLTPEALTDRLSKEVQELPEADRQKVLEKAKVEQPFRRSFDVKVEDAKQEAKGQEVEVRLVLKGSKNIRIRARADLTSSWIDLSGLLAPVKDKDEDRPIVQPFSIPIEHYAGVEDGEAWEEGSKDKSIYLSSLPAGEYILRINVYCDPNARQGGGRFQPPIGGFNFGAAEVRSFELNVEQGYPRFWHIFWTCVFLTIIPLIVWIMSASFEKRRWSNSNVTPGGT